MSTNFQASVRAALPQELPAARKLSLITLGGILTRPQNGFRIALFAIALVGAWCPRLSWCRHTRMAAGMIRFKVFFVSGPRCLVGALKLPPSAVIGNYPAYPPVLTMLSMGPFTSANNRSARWLTCSRAFQRCTADTRGHAVEVNNSTVRESMEVLRLKGHFLLHCLLFWKLTLRQ